MDGDDGTQTNGVINEEKIIYKNRSVKKKFRRSFKVRNYVLHKNSN